MAEKSLWFRMFGEDRVTPVFKKVGVEAEATAVQVRAAFAESGAMIGGPIGAGTAKANRGFKAMGAGSLMTAGIVAGAVGAIAYHTTKMAADFQSSIVKLQTTAGESKKNLDVVSQGILNMAGKVGYSSQQLADGMYTVESAGFHGAEGLKVMSAAAKGARTEGADLTTVTDAVTSAMVDFHMHGAKGAAEATNTLIAAVGHGKTTMEGMAAAFPNVAAAAASVGVSMQETAAAIATMTQHGTDAAKAGTYLRQVLGQLASGGSAQAQKVMAGLGLSSAKVSKELGTRGLAATIGTLQNALKKHLTPAGLEALNMFKKSNTPIATYHTLMHKMGGGTLTTFGALTKMVGGVKSLQGILQLGGENLKTFKANTAAVTKQVEEGGKGVEGFSTYQKTFNAQVNDAKGALSALGISIGTDLLPAMTSLVKQLGTGVRWLGQHKKATELALVSVAGLAAAIVAYKLVMIPVSAATALFTAAQSAARAAALGTRIELGALKVQELALAAAQRISAEVTALWTVAQTAAKDAAIGTRIGLAALAVQQFAIATGAKIAAAAQWLWNAALDANPIGIVVVALGALVGGLIYAYGHFKAFRDFVNAAWHDIKSAAVAVGHWFAGPFVDFFTSGAKAVGHFFSGPFVHFFTGAWDKIKAAASAVGNWLKSHWRAIVVGIATVIAGPLGAIVALIATHWSQVKAATSAAWNAVKSAVSGAWHAIASAVSAGIGHVVSFVRSLPGKIKAALGNLGHLLWSAGADLIHGLIGGIQSMVGSALSTVGNLASSIGGHFKSMLGIHSPSTVFHGYGENVVEGLINGINGKKGALQNAMSAAAQLVKDAGAKLQSDLQAQSQFEQGFISSFSQNVFGATDQTTGNPLDVAGMIALAKQQKAAALQLQSDMKRLTKEGISQSLLQQLATSGSSGASQIHMLATGPASQVAQLNRLDKQTGSALSGAAKIAGTDIYGAKIAADRERQKTADTIAKAVGKAIKAEKLAEKNKKAIHDGVTSAKLGEHVQKGAEAGVAGLRADLHDVKAAIAGQARELQKLQRQGATKGGKK